MVRILSVFLLLFSVSFKIYAQEDLFKVITIPKDLMDKSNAVVRTDDIKIEILAYNEVVYTNHRIITILNEEGNSKLGALVHYDDNIKIKTLEARVYNANGELVKKIKEKDFQDASAVSGGTLYSDNRVKYLDYTPTSYPYTLELNVEMKFSSTAFLPGWRPIEGFYVSTQNASYKIENVSGIEVRIKTSNFGKYNITDKGDNYYVAKNLKSIKPEVYSPSFSSYAPFLKATLAIFDMEGIQGFNSDWKDFGKWMHKELLSGTELVPEIVIQEVKTLTSGVSDPIEKAKIVYNYIQNKTRYISVQVGIGGWKPMLAEDVNRLGYGDCKGLSNYTRALLKEVGVESFYTVVYGDSDLINIDKEFSTTEGNHVILTIPNDDDYIWLECTSQTNPFGYIAGWTDDRDVLVIKPEGGEIVHTTIYNRENNLQETKAKVVLSNNGSISGNVTISAQGYQYALREGIQNESLRDQRLYYLNSWDYINNLSLEKIEFSNDKEQVIFKENLTFISKDYATISGNRLLFQPNVFNRKTSIPTRYKNRTLNFEIQRGFIDRDEFIINVDTNIEVEAIPENVSISTKFGHYSFSVEIKDSKTLIYRRTYSLNKGAYPKEDYDDFRNFMSQIMRKDKSKIVLIAKK